MYALTLKALKGSIKHWKENTEAETPSDASTKWRDCPLCVEFIEKGCTGCPVFEKTGSDCCAGTPYHKASIAFSAWSKDEQFKENFITAAKEELKFLKSLLPKKEKA